METEIIRLELLEEFAQVSQSFAIQHCSKFRVTAIASSKILAIYLAKSSNKSVPALPTDFAVLIA